MSPLDLCESTENVTIYTQKVYLDFKKTNKKYIGYIAFPKA